MSRFWHWPDKIIRKRESRRLRDEHNKLAQEHAGMLAALEQLERVESSPHSETVRFLAREDARAAIARARGEG